MITNHTRRRISMAQCRRGCLHHLDGLLWPWPLESNQVVSRG